jgi:hypothetical protein
MKNATVLAKVFGTLKNIAKNYQNQEVQLKLINQTKLTVTLSVV